MIYPSNFEVKTGFDKIRNRLNELCLSSLGITKVDEMRFSSDFQQVFKLLNLSGEFKKLMLDEEAFPDNYFFDLTKVLHHWIFLFHQLLNFESYNLLDYQEQL